MVKRGLILFLAILMLLVIVFSVSNYHKSAYSLNDFEIDLSDLRYNNELVYYKYITSFNKTKIYKTSFSAKDYDELINRINGSSINYTICNNDFELDERIKKHVETENVKIAFEGCRTLQNPIKSTSEQLLILIAQENDSITVYFCNWT